MQFGKTLRAAREAKGFSTSELAAITHLLVQVIEGLENEDFRRIPAPIYGRGFVKLYCEAVGLEPKPLQAEFMTLYSLGKDAPAKVPAPPTPPPKATPIPPPTPEPAPVPEPAAPPPTQEPVKPEQVASPEPEIAPIVPEPAPEPEPVASPLPTQEPVKPERVAPPPRRSYGELFEQSYATEQPVKPSAAEKFRDTMSNVSAGVFSNVKKLPPNTGRIATVAIGVVILLALIAWGIFELYKATSAGSTTENDRNVTVLPAQPAAQKDASPAKKDLTAKKDHSSKPATAKSAAAAKDLKSSGTDVPSLYID